MKYLKLYENFLLLENFKLEVPEIIEVKINLKVIKYQKIWEGTIFKDFLKAYKFLVEFDKYLEKLATIETSAPISSRRRQGRKDLVCTSAHMRIWNVARTTADHQVTVLREEYPEPGMKSIPVEIGSNPELVTKIDDFLKTPLKGTVLLNGEDADFETYEDLPDTEFNKHASVIAKELGTTLDFIWKVRLFNFRQRNLTTEWDEKKVNQHPNNDKSQKIFSMCKKWFEYCKDDGDDFKIDNGNKKDTKYNYVFNIDTPSINKSGGGNLGGRSGEDTPLSPEQY